MKRSLIALALAAVLPLSAQAGELNYNYIQADYLNSDFVGENFDGFGIAGSVKFNDAFYGSASYRKVDNGDFDIDLDETVISLGWRHGLSDKADFLAEVGYVNVGVDAGELGDASEDGYRVGAGFRGSFNDKFEGSIKGFYTDLGGDEDGEFGARVAGLFKINPTWGIEASYETTQYGGENFDTWGLGVRASF
jgi:hypothetical protein